MKIRQSFLLMGLFLLSSYVTFGQNPEIKWWFDLNDSAFGSAAAEDIDGDNKYEIVFGCYRNDSTVYALNGEDGTLLWKRNLAGSLDGCNDVAPLIYDVDQDGSLEVIVPSSCNPKTFCFEGATGNTVWERPLHGSDSPPTIADADGDGKPEILHGNFGGSVSCLNAEDGSIAWDLMVDPNSWIQTAPTILDADNDGDLDFFVANSSFGADHKFYCFRLRDQQLLWESDLPEGRMYHGAAVADLDGDGFKELVIGSYDGKVYALNAEDGSLSWSFEFPISIYTAAAISIADVNNDQQYEVIFFDLGIMGVLSHEGRLLWSLELSSLGQSFRGAAISDINGDNQLDIVFAATNGILYALDGSLGELIWQIDLAAHYGSNEFQLDHGPLIADFDEDGLLDVFVVGGHTAYPDFTENYGRAYLISTNSTGGPEWLMFRRDSVRSGHLPLPNPTAVTTPLNTEDHLSLSPNPSSGPVDVHIDLKIGREVSLEIYDVQGRLLRTLHDGYLRAGKTRFVWNKEPRFLSGVYYCLLKSELRSIVEKVIIE